MQGRSPCVDACVDCHLMNVGGFATPERNRVLDINDFEETLPAPFEWDVKPVAPEEEGSERGRAARSQA